MTRFNHVNDQGQQRTVKAGPLGAACTLALGSVFLNLLTLSLTTGGPSGQALPGGLRGSESDWQLEGTFKVEAGAVHILVVMTALWLGWTGGGHQGCEGPEGSQGFGSLSEFGNREKNSGLAQKAL